MARAETYRALPVKKRKLFYYRLWAAVGSKRLVDRETARLKGNGLKYFVERVDKKPVEWRIWYRPTTRDGQGIASRDYKRYKAEKRLRGGK